MKNLHSIVVGMALFAVLLIPRTTAVASPTIGNLELEIQHPVTGTVLTNSEQSIEVRGSASVFGGVRQLDLMLLIDTSKSLKSSDPKHYRLAGAIELLESLPEWSDIQVGVVAFSRKAKLLSPLTKDHQVTIKALRGLRYGTSTNLAAGIDTALEGFERGAREGSSRVVLIFTDGKSNEKKAQAAMARARDRSVAIHSLLLGRDEKGERILRSIATGTGGSFALVTNPKELPAAFAGLRTTGVESVTLTVNDSPPIDTLLTMGSFSAEVPLARGENRIVATVTSRDGTTREEAVTVSLRPHACAELAIQAMREGQPALSVSNRSVEIVIDASRSMWGQLHGQTKMEIARRSLEESLGWLPKDWALSLRAYGHRNAPSARDCRDTELLVAADAGNRTAIRSAIAGLKPKGQTPLGYALEQVARDFKGASGERAVVLVTDGIESCGGDAPAAARALQADGPVPVHVIGFGMGDASAEDLASLRAIADASGGRFVTAGSARELERALMTTVGTSFSVTYDDAVLGEGTLGSEDVIRLPAGDYVVKLDSSPPQKALVALESAVRQTIAFVPIEEGEVRMATSHDIEYSACEESAEALVAAGPEETRPAPAKLAPNSAKSGGEDAPRARRVALFDVEGGSVELWRNLRPDRKSDWGVIVRHPTVGAKPRMIHSGNDRAVAEAIAKSTRDMLDDGES